MVDRSLVFFLVSFNAVALAFLYQRGVSTGLLPPAAQLANAAVERISFLAEDYITPYQPCGHLDAATYVLYSRRVVTPTGVQAAAIHISNGKITAVLNATSRPVGDDLHVIDYGNLVISPGVIDVHAHLNEPGRVEWEGMETGTSAAAAGGVTTVVDMPLNSAPCTTTGERVKEKVALGKTKSRVNIGFWGGLVPENAEKPSMLQGMLDAGALGFKAFMSPSGIDDFPNVSAAHIGSALPFMQAAGVPLLVHAELVSQVVEPEGPVNEYKTYHKTRPPQYERDAFFALLQAIMANSRAKPAEGFHLHIAHLADGDTLPMVRAAKRRWHFTAETCPHYLLFAAEEIPPGATQYKCAPPIRTAANQRTLLRGIGEGTIDLVASDHSPAPASLKATDTGDFIKAWGGISGLQYLLPATWTALKRASGAGAPPADLALLAKLLSGAPANLAGLGVRRGSIEAGKYADLVIWDPDAPADTTEEGYYHRHKLSPYRDMALQGRVAATYVNGHRVFSSDAGVAQQACGRVVKRSY